MSPNKVKRMRGITVRVPKDLLVQLQAQTGWGVSETVRAALKSLVPTHTRQQSKSKFGTANPPGRAKQARI